MSQWTLPWNQLLHKAMICGPVLPLVRLCFIITIRSWQKCEIVKSLLAICIKSSKVRLTHVILMASWSKGPILHGTFLHCAWLCPGHMPWAFSSHTHTINASQKNELFSHFFKKETLHEKSLLIKQSLYIHTQQAFFKLNVLTDYYTSIGLAIFLKELQNWW